MHLADYLRATEEVIDGGLDALKPRTRELIAHLLRRAEERVRHGRDPSLTEPGKPSTRKTHAHG